MVNAVRSVLLCMMFVGVAATWTASADVRHLPNLSPVPPRQIDVAPADDPQQGLALRFSTTTYNLGDWALDVVGLPPRDPTRTGAQQCTSWTATHVCAGRVDVGDFVWHPAHAHWHLEDYALYELRALDEDGRPDASPGGLVAGGQKVTFCLADIDPPEDHMGSGVGFYTAACPGILQGISAGWADTYHRDLPGQQILLAGVPAGDYALVITIDPDGKLLETDETDNVAWAHVSIPSMD